MAAPDAAGAETPATAAAEAPAPLDPAAAETPASLEAAPVDPPASLDAAAARTPSGRCRADAGRRRSSSSTIESTSRPPVSKITASSATASGEVARVESR